MFRYVHYQPDISIRNTKLPTSYSYVFLFTSLTTTSLNAQTNSDANLDAADEASPSGPPSKQGPGPSSKPVRRRRAGQPPAPVGLAEEPESEPATTRKRHKRRAGTLIAISSRNLTRARLYQHLDTALFRMDRDGTSGYIGRNSL